MPRYIDAVSKAEVLETYAELYDVFDDYKGIQKELHKVYDKLNDLPTADVRENVHAHLNKVKMKSGEWWHTCSKCIATWGSEDGELDFKFCPNCGAQMDERSGEDE